MSNARSRRSPPRWARYADERLLELRLCDLGIRVVGSPLEKHLARLHRELKSRGLRFRPHAWLATSWFSPDGIPGVAIPFFLAHPRLARLEETQMLEVEGGSSESCMQLLRHEAGHALDNAFRIHRRASWRKTFGKYSTPYARHYRPRPHSRDFVHHLDFWYAQSHPAEDWAETFSVWLSTKPSAWRRDYAEWPALSKLEYVHQLMKELEGETAEVRSNECYETIDEDETTLARFYEQRKSERRLEFPAVYDRDLTRLFGPREQSTRPARAVTAATFLRRHRATLRTSVAPWTGESPFIVDQVLRRVVARCERLNLYVVHPEKHTLDEAALFITVRTMNYIHSGRLERAR